MLLSLTRSVQLPRLNVIRAERTLDCIGHRFVLPRPIARFSTQDLRVRSVYTSQRVAAKRLKKATLAYERSVMPETPSKAPLVWIDCEMTGLDIENDTILSLACFVTDSSLNLLDEEGYVVEVHHNQQALENMGAWCTEHHQKSGLWDRCLNSNVTADAASKGCLDYILKYAPQERKALLAGNTVHMDKAFLVKEPWRPIVKHLHHRILDVSAIKEAMKRWSPLAVTKGSPAKQNLHDAKQDILESIAEARYYREKIFVRE